MQKVPPARGKLLLMALFAFSCFAIGLYMWKSFGGATPLAPVGYRMSVNFSNATQLASGAEVRISGVPVGHVVGLSRNGVFTRATLEVSSPVARDTRAILREKTLLGETYVELSPGDRRSGMLPDRGTLPRSQVERTTQLDDVTRTLDAPTRRSLQVLVAEVGSGLGSRGEQLNNTLGGFEPFASDAGNTLAVLDAEHSAVRQLVSDSGAVFEALGQRQGDLTGLIRSGDAVLSTTAARNHDLAAAVNILPKTLSVLRPTLSEVSTVSRDAAPTVSALRGPARSLGPTLIDATALAPSLRSLFRDVDRTTTVSRTALPALTRIVDAAQPVFHVLVPTLRQLLPVVDYLGLYKHELAAEVAGLASSTEASASPGPGLAPVHYIRVLVPFTSEGAMVQAHRLGSNRHNPYLLPLALLNLGHGLDAFDCMNTHNVSSPEPAPPCKPQQPLLFEGKRFDFPHVDLAP